MANYGCELCLSSSEGLIVVVVCSCAVVSDRTIRAAIAGGVTTVGDLVTCSRAGSGCGGCLSEIERLLADHDLEHRAVLAQAC